MQFVFFHLASPAKVCGPLARPRWFQAPQLQGSSQDRGLRLQDGLGAGVAVRMHSVFWSVSGGNSVVAATLPLQVAVETHTLPLPPQLSLHLQDCLWPPLNSLILARVPSATFWLKYQRQPHLNAPAVLEFRKKSLELLSLISYGPYMRMGSVIMMSPTSSNL